MRARTRAHAYTWRMSGALTPQGLHIIELGKSTLDTHFVAKICREEIVRRATQCVCRPWFLSLSLFMRSCAERAHAVHGENRAPQHRKKVTTEKKFFFSFLLESLLRKCITLSYSCICVYACVCVFLLVHGRGKYLSNNNDSPVKTSYMYVIMHSFGKKKAESGHTPSSFRRCCHHIYSWLLLFLLLSLFSIVGFLLLLSLLNY